MNSLLSAIKAFVLKNRPAYKDYLGNGKYDVKKLPEECVPDSVNDKIRTARNKADSAYDTADLAYSEAESAYDNANLAYDKASDINSRLFKLTNLNYNFGTLEYTSAKSENVYAWSIRTDGISDIPLAESKAPMACYFDIVLKDSNNNQIGKYSAFDKKIVRGITKISEMYRLFIDERTKIGSDGYAELKIGYEFKNDDNLWHRSIRVNVKLPSTDINNTNISSVFLNAWSSLVDVDNYAPWPSICVPLAGTNDAGVVYASDKTDDQTVPVSIDKNGYLWCKGSETTTPDWYQNDPTARDYIKNRPGGYPGTFETIFDRDITLNTEGNLYNCTIDPAEFVLESGCNYEVTHDATTYVAECIYESGDAYDSYFLADEVNRIFVAYTAMKDGSSNVNEIMSENDISHLTVKKIIIPNQKFPEEYIPDVFCRKTIFYTNTIKLNRPYTLYTDRNLTTPATNIELKESYKKGLVYIYDVGYVSATNIAMAMSCEIIGEGVGYNNRTFGTLAPLQ